MEKIPIFSLPCPSSEAISDPKLIDRERGLLLSMVCDVEGRKFSQGVLFVKPRAVRTRAEIYCSIWHLTDTYDTVCEVMESDWVAELKSHAVPDWRERWVMRHFILYLDSFGFIEAVAESV